MSDAHLPSAAGGGLEERLLEYAFGEQSDAMAADLAQRVADSEDALAYLVQLFDDLCALHDRAGSSAAASTPPRAVAAARIDELLDDVMILLAARGGPGGGQVVAGAGQAASVGESERS